MVGAGQWRTDEFMILSHGVKLHPLSFERLITEVPGDLLNGHHPQLTVRFVIAINCRIRALH